jgi:hypothetical protein
MVSDPNWVGLVAPCGCLSRGIVIRRWPLPEGAMAREVQPLQGCDPHYTSSRRLTPAAIQVTPLRGSQRRPTNSGGALPTGLAAR